MPGPIGQKGEPGPAVNITELKASLREHKKGKIDAFQLSAEYVRHYRS